MDQGQSFFFQQSSPPAHHDPLVTFISMAARFGDVVTLRKLMREAVAAEGVQFLSSATVGLALKRATQGGQVEVLQCLVEGGVDINTQFKGASALHEAVKVNNTQVLEYLLSVPGLLKETLSMAHKTPLMEAACRGRVRCLTLLLSCGACPPGTRSTPRGLTALHHALLPPVGCLRPEDTLECLELLRRHGGDLDARDRHGATPLHLAVATENVSVVVWFLRRNADLEVEARPADLAPGIFSCLEGGVALTPLLLALHLSNRPLVELLVACGARPTRLAWTLPYCRPYRLLHDFLLRSCLGVVPPLQALCRGAARAALRGGRVGGLSSSGVVEDVEEKVARLTCLPESVRRYLLLTEELAQAGHSP